MARFYVEKVELSGFNAALMQLDFYLLGAEHEYQWHHFSRWPELTHGR